MGKGRGRLTISLPPNAYRTPRPVVSPCTHRISMSFLLLPISWNDAQTFRAQTHRPSPQRLRPRFDVSQESVAVAGAKRGRTAARDVELLAGGLLACHDGVGGQLGACGERALSGAPGPRWGLDEPELKACHSTGIVIFGLWVKCESEVGKRERERELEEHGGAVTRPHRSTTVLDVLARRPHLSVQSPFSRLDAMIAVCAEVA